MQYIDFHTHILPKMDDGAKTVSESIAMLHAAQDCGAKTVVCTPHYHPEEPIADFLARRNRAFALLTDAICNETKPMPNIVLGAEISLSGSLSEQEDIHRLCIEGTDSILLEMPYPIWNKWHVQEVYNLIARRNLTPVMAHIERYLKKPKDIEKIENLISIGAKFQVNADSVLTFGGRRVIKTLAKEGVICAIGSDCHRKDRRTADISRPLTMLQKHLGNSFLHDVYRQSSALLLQK